jgi:hypothetical protein
VEWLHGDACVKYILKYVTKGCDMAFVSVGTDGPVDVFNYDEFRQIHMARFQTASEALMSIWGHKIVRMTHQVKLVNDNLYV